MKRRQRLLLIIIAALLVSVAAAVIPRMSGEASAQSATNKPESASESKGLHTLFDSYFEEFLRLNPLFATSIGDHRFDDRLTIGPSDEYRSKMKALYTKYLNDIPRINRNPFNQEDRLSCEVFKRSIESSLERLRFDDHLTPISQFEGLHILFPLLGSGRGGHPFKTVENYENFLGRIGGFQVWSENAIADMRKGMTVGRVQPRVLMEKALPQLESMVVADVKQSIFYQPVANIPAHFSPQDKVRLTEAYTEAITEQVIPTFQRLHNFIRTEYLPHARSTVGLSALPKGQEQYEYLVKFYTTTNLTSEEIFRIGLNEVRRIKGEMEGVKGQVGFKGDLKAFFEHLRTDPKFYPFTSDQEVLDAYRAIEARMQPRLPKLFNMVPKAKFEVRLTEKFRAATASHSYTGAAPDGSRPGIFNVPVVDAKKYSSYRMESVFLHEAIPGHHYQISLQQERKNLPKFRQHGGYGAYTEGWGLYAESLGKELGLYTDPYQYFGRLEAEMHRAIRLVVDVGIHAKGWSREQAIAYSLENNSISEARATSEVERYIALPGQALSYKIGELKIQELRRKADKALGSRLDIRAFHDEILRDGALPLDVLEMKVTKGSRSKDR